MRHRTFAVASLLSLLLCLATVVLWVRSYFVWEVVSWDSSDSIESRFRAVGLSSGALHLAHVTAKTGLYPVPKARGYSSQSPRGDPLPIPPKWSFLGFAETESVLPGYELKDLQIPLGLIAITFVVMPLCYSLGPRKQKANHCLRCRYDLTGNTSGTCPECGTAVPSPPGLLDPSCGPAQPPP